MQVKKVLAVVMSLCLVTGAMSYGAPFISQDLTAQAAAVKAECYSFDEATGVLTLKGEVQRDAIREFSYDMDEKVKKVIAEKGTVLPENSSMLFYYYSNCTSIDLSKADTRCVTNMKSMFSECSALTKLDISSFDTSNVTSMEDMFYGCSALSSLDVSGFDTSSVTNMSCMFYGCSGLSSLDVRSFDTGKVTQMSGMFLNCRKLTSIDVSNFDTGSVKNMGSMFYGCSGLKKLDLSKFNTSSVEYMYSMFNGCYSLTSVDVSGFDTRNVIEMYTLFAGCTELTSVDLSSFDTSSVEYMNDMFTLCTKLNTLTLGKNFKKLPENAYLPNGDGWVNASAPSKVVSGSGTYAVIENSGKNTYKRLGAQEEKPLTYPTNIKVEYSEKNHQVRFRWDEVENAEKYGIAVFMANKWRIQSQNITEPVYTSPKNLLPGRTYKVCIAAKVDGKWDIDNAIRNAVTVTIR
ncbi:BspA family leucine-rich repeat surface protein [uncultured Ruminococcus sp.]|uniref:BspA family leucine-rich repeat surface protein n=1 Tax=uncultured Ruminococcus sp. TaxID=165186 RepID=UPI0025CE3428|nr:BspA family leucine-rich repeat surface protein [uncultured Ruminococcus sp.]